MAGGGGGGGRRCTSEVLKLEPGSILGYTPFPGHMVGVNRSSRRRTDRTVHGTSEEFWVKPTQILFWNVSDEICLLRHAPRPPSSPP